ncbi:MAG: ATP-grasp domain-containing protein [Candidatus Hydrogenedentes bacterium]|nr:ATP-grasp domain-containing protein [Candidatus Hydrogenedentota bacterium]
MTRFAKSESPRVMIIAGGEWQVPLIRKAKAMGCYVINSNLYPDSPGFKFADVGLVANVLDKEKNLAFAREHQPDAVITDQSDIAVPTVAYICEELGLPGIGVDMAHLFTNKYAMRSFLAEHGFPCPAYRLCGTLEEAMDFAHETGLPLILKPPQNQSSRGVLKVTAQDELPAAFAHARSHSHSGAVLVEQFIGGVEHTVEGYKSPKGCDTLAISRKNHYAHNPMVASRLLYSWEDADADYDELGQLNARLVESMGLPFGITHAEYKSFEGQFYLVEIAARGGGTKLSSHMIPLMSGVDANELLILHALGETPPLPVPEKRIIYAALDFLVFADGHVAAIDGAEDVLAHPNVIDFQLGVRPGDTVRPAADDRSRHGHIIAHAETRESLLSMLAELSALVRVTYA